MQKFKSPALAQQFLSTMEHASNLLKVGRYKHSAQEYKSKLKNALVVFGEIVHSHHKFA